MKVIYQPLPKYAGTAIPQEKLRGRGTFYKEVPSKEKIECLGRMIPARITKEEMTSKEVDEFLRIDK